MFDNIKRIFRKGTATMPPEDKEEKPDEENQETPNSGDSSKDTFQVSKDDYNSLVGRLDTQDKQIKAFQSGQDKQIGKNRAEIDRILALSEKGKDASDIERELVIDNLLDPDRQIADPGSSDSGRTEEPNELNVDAVAKEFGLDPNSVLVAGAKIAFKDDQKGLFEKLETMGKVQEKPSGTANHPQGSSDLGKLNEDDQEGPFADMSDDDLGGQLIELGREGFADNAEQRNKINEELARRDKVKE